MSKTERKLIITVDYSTEGPGKWKLWIYGDPYWSETGYGFDSVTDEKLEESCATALRNVLDQMRKGR